MAVAYIAPRRSYLECRLLTGYYMFIETIL